jgi:hypothetical protein
MLITLLDLYISILTFLVLFEDTLDQGNDYLYHFCGVKHKKKKEKGPKKNYIYFILPVSQNVPTYLDLE